MHILHLNSGQAVSATNPSLAGDVATKSITFAAGTTGAIGTTTLFTVTGTIVCFLIVKCGTSVVTTGGGGTVHFGVPGLIDLFLGGGLTGDTLLTDYVATSGAADVGVALQSADGYTTAKNIILTVADNTIISGQLSFHLVWYPISSGATVVAA